MKVVTAGETIELGVTEIRPTIEITDFSRRVTDDFGVTTVVPRAFSRRMSVRFAMPTTDVDRVQRRLAELRATTARWTADPRFAWLNFEGFYKDLNLDLAVPPLSYCTLTVEGLAETEAVPDPGGDPAPDGRSSTLLLLHPLDVTDAELTSSNVPEYDHPEWSPGISYAMGAKVIRAGAHRIYESAADGNQGNSPDGDSGLWIDIGPTNRWAMFDQALGTVTSLNDGITVVLTSPAIRAVALLDVVGSTVRVQGPGYDRTQAVGDGAILFGDLPGGPGDVTVTIAGAGSVAVGTLLIGKLAALGDTGADASAGINDFSRKERDDFGEWTIVPRSWSKTMSVKALIRTDAVDLVANRIAAARARPSLWIGAENLDCLTIYGFFRGFSIEAGANVSVLSLDVEGLSEAAPIGGGLPPVSWPDVVDSDPVNRPKPEDGATVGGTIGENVKDSGGNVVPPEDLLTSLGISADTVKVAGVDGNDLLNAISTAQDEIDGLIETYGETAAASAAAQEARDARDVALGAATAAGGHASTASTKRDEASGFALAAHGDAVAAGDAASVATAKAAAAGVSESSAADSATLSANHRDTAQAQANIAIDRAGVANAAAAAAAASQTVSAQYSDAAFAALLQSHPTDMSGKEAYWYPTTAPNPGQFSGYEQIDGAWVQSCFLMSSDFRCRWSYPATPGKTYRVYVEAKSGGTGTLLMSAFASNAPNLSGYGWLGFFGTGPTLTTSWDVYEFDYTAPAGAAPYVELAPLLIGNTDWTHVKSIRVEDVTSEKASAAQAAISTNSAAVATASAAAAEQHMLVSASLGSGALNDNASFAVWPTGQALPSKWSQFTAIGTGAYIIKRPPSHIPGATTSPYFMELMNPANGDFCATVGDDFNVQPGAWHALQVDAQIGDGSWAGSGMSAEWKDSSGVVVRRDIILFHTDVTIDGGTAYSVPGAYFTKKTWSRLVQAPTNATKCCIMLAAAYQYGLFGYSTPTNPAKVIYVFKALVRPATAAEVRDQTVLAPMEATVSDHTSVLATHDTMLATRVIRTQAGPTSAEVAFHSLASGGGAASQITIRADEVALGDMTKIALKVRGGDALFSGNINAGGGIFVGDRAIPVALQSFPMEVYDGQAVSYGASLGNIPDIVADFSGFAALPAGQSYVFRAEGHTPSGFTARVKTLSSATLATATNTGATTPGTGPTFQMHKADARDAYNGRYTFVVTGSMYRVEQELIEPPKTVYQGYVALRFWVRPAGASSWTDCGVKYVGASPGPTGNYTYTSGVQVDFGGAIGLDPTNTEFGVSFEGGWSGTNTLTGLNSVSYQYQVSGSETTATPGNTPLLPIRVMPKNQ